MRPLSLVFVVAVLAACPSNASGQELDPAFKADIEKLMEVTATSKG
jgi:hypothetical protein